MAMRLRTVKGVRVALCAAKTKPQDNDVYLTDSDHEALSVRFDLDVHSMFPELSVSIHGDSVEAKIMQEEENKFRWDERLEKWVTKGGDA